MKWQHEQSILNHIVDYIPGGSTVLDIPCGTGRLFKFFATQRLKVIAMDISEDMLAEAREKGSYKDIDIRSGDIFTIDLPDGAVEYAFAIRIMNKIGVEDVPAALSELQRVTQKQIVFNLRVDFGNSRFRHPVPLSVVREALIDGWHIATTQEIHEHDFRMITLQRGQE